MPVYNWDKLERVSLNPLITGKVVESKKAMVARITCPVGDVNMHVHEFDQITNMLRGKMRWVIQGEGEFVVGPGDVMVMEAGVAHGGEVLEEAEYLDVFVPPRQDWSWYKQRL
jgi:quercetin dioxygenase-like cupin family protein